MKLRHLDRQSFGAVQVHRHAWPRVGKIREHHLRAVGCQQTPGAAFALARNDIDQGPFAGRMIMLLRRTHAQRHQVFPGPRFLILAVPHRPNRHELQFAFLIWPDEAGDAGRGYAAGREQVAVFLPGHDRQALRVHGFGIEPDSHCVLRA